MVDVWAHSDVPKRPPSSNTPTLNRLADDFRISDGIPVVPTDALASIAVIWRRELGVLVNWTDILDGEIVNAAWAVAGMAARPRPSRRVAADLDTAAPAWWCASTSRRWCSPT